MLLTNGQSTYKFYPVRYRDEVSQSFVIRQYIINKTGECHQSYVGQTTANDEVGKLLNEGYSIDFTSINY